MRTAFYPCCGSDFEYPSQLLSGMVDRIIFCDIHQECSKRLERFKGQIGAVEVEFIAGDVRGIIGQMGKIDVFFYRGDSRGEGGSGVYILAKKFVDTLAKHFGEEALIITDGRNSGDKLFQRMIRPEGYIRLGRHYQPKLGVAQPNSEGLYTIQVKSIESQQ